MLARLLILALVSFVARGEEHWSFKAVTRPESPATKLANFVRNPIDAFVAAKLEAAGLSPSAEADRRILVRRLYFDLTGLPPSPEAVERFLRDHRADAYERLADELLDSPRFGERWARHWLDAVRFAETHGFEMNQPRANAWPYRDYVIRAFNEDVPYDRFVKEQLAGDALGEDEATGFLVAGPWDQVKSPDEVLTKNQRADELHDMVNTTGATFLGLTLGCARCHNHKFDPIPQRDYFAIKATLEGVQHGERAVRDPNEAPSNLRAAVHPRENTEEFAPIKTKSVRFTVLATTGSEPCIDELEVYTTAGSNVALGAKASASSVYPNSEIHRLEHINDGKRGNGRSWISAEQGKGWVRLDFGEETEIARIVWGRDREEKFKDRLATDYRIEISSDGEAWAEVASSKDRKPFKDEKKIYAGEFKAPEPTARWHRGDPMLPREIVAPGFLSKIAAAESSLSTNTVERERRIALADWIVSTNNPLTARVIVNRIWLGHFGEGLVSTPSDFGKNGAAPSHPELLDWLASELMGNRWSLKHVHRLILNSATYRQASAAQSDGLAKDAGARLLWRFPPRRLEAEALRDSILAAAGKLDLRMGGPGWSPFEPNDNYVRVYNPKSEFEPGDFRRMIYAINVRQRPEGVFGAFDCPDGGQIAPKRLRSATPLQALNLLNSGFMTQASNAFAERLAKESAPERAAFRIAFQREPSREEAERSAEFIRAHSLGLFARAILNSNEFCWLE